LTPEKQIAKSFLHKAREATMPRDDVFSDIKRAIEAAPRNAYVAELHLQVLKHAELLEDISGKEFCAGLGLKPAWGTEYAKMKKIAPRLRDAGLDPDKI
jgi:hypothetical protein